MKCFSLFLISAASFATLAAGQVLTTTAQAQPVSPPLYQVRLDWQKAEPGPGGLVIRGCITNTGTTPLTYTQVTPTLVNRTGTEVFRGSGYLTASPLLPGQSAEFRACEPDAPRFAGLRMVFREAGHPVQIERVPVERIGRR
jgi:hypothetical protein